MFDSTKYLFLRAIIASEGDCYTAKGKSVDKEECVMCPLDLSGNCTTHRAKQKAIELLDEEVKELIEG